MQHACGIYADSARLTTRVVYDCAQYIACAPCTNSILALRSISCEGWSQQKNLLPGFVRYGHILFYQQLPIIPALPSLQDYLQYQYCQHYQHYTWDPYITYLYITSITYFTNYQYYQHYLVYRITYITCIVYITVASIT